jgi:hypothetical protein
MAADAEAFGKADRLGGGGDPWVKPRDDEIKRRGDGMEMSHSQGSPA